jgi:hypothetical protein
MTEKESYHQYLAEQWQPRSCFDCYDRCRPGRRTTDQDELCLSSLKNLKALDWDLGCSCTVAAM